MTEFTTPPTSEPWRNIVHDGATYMVRWTKQAVWACRLPDRAIWLWLPADAPEWTKAMA